MYVIVEKMHTKWDNCGGTRNAFFCSFVLGNIFCWHDIVACLARVMFTLLVGKALCVIIVITIIIIVVFIATAGQVRLWWLHITFLEEMYVKWIKLFSLLLRSLHHPSWDASAFLSPRTKCNCTYTRQGNGRIPTVKRKWFHATCLVLYYFFQKSKVSYIWRKMKKIVCYHRDHVNINLKNHYYHHHDFLHLQTNMMRKQFLKWSRKLYFTSVWCLCCNEYCW